ncbi:Putative peptidoglycan binding domain-containing protein [Ornithinimicrobium cerasi]|uniref:Peptidoglycan binding domain-containing protein n=1 Tax=Ornithinimicrobium cerasi TaxID=2248773 RepID=A0A285VSD6_9MICO|nr:Putative peptidoglycan binding domain-containing protein [Ornithinimicrobium cerasi]
MVNTKSPRDVAQRERTLRERGFTVYDGPSVVQRGSCFPGAPGHPHRADSTHFVDERGRFDGRRVGGAVDVGRDPSTGEAISTFEKAHLDDLARVLKREGFRVIWGVEAHFDHLHFDYNVGGGHELRFMGPNGEFTVAHIADVQRQLSALRRTNGRRYYTGTIDGLREKHTLRAIKAFQRDHGLDDDGDPGQGTRDALRAALARQASKPKPKPSKPEPKPPKPEPKKPDATIAGIAGLGGGDLRARLAPFRIAGQNAFATAIAADRFTAPAGKGILLAARGTPDETAGSLAAFRTGASFLPLGPDGGLPGPVRRHLEETRPQWVRVVGGFLAVPDETLARILAAAGIRF